MKKEMGKKRDQSILIVWPIVITAILISVVLTMCIIEQGNFLKKYKNWNNERKKEVAIKNLVIKQGYIFPVAKAGRHVTRKDEGEYIHCRIRGMKKHLNDKIIIIGKIDDLGEEYLVQYKAYGGFQVEDVYGLRVCDDGIAYIATRREIYYAKKQHERLSELARKKAEKEDRRRILKGIKESRIKELLKKAR